MNQPTDEISDLNVAIRKLRTTYDQYFAGIERKEPLKDRDEIKKTLRRLLTSRNNNTAFKFRLQSAQQTLLTYETYWDRIAKQIEEGTFKRDKLKAQRMLSPGAADDAQEGEAPQPGVETPKSAQTTERAAARPAPPGDAAYPESLRKLHESFVRARAEAGDPRPVSLESLADTVKKQIAAVKAQYGCERVEFKVALKDGKAVLKAIPR